MRTTDKFGLMSRSPSNLLSQSLCDEETQAWNALAEIGRQLQFLAKARTGEGNLFSPVPSPPNTADRLTVSNLVSLTLDAKERAGRDISYTRQLTYTLRPFRLALGKKFIDEISHGDIEKFLHALPVGARRRLGYRDDIRMMFNLAVKRGWLEKNPARAIELAPSDDGEVAIHAPATVKHVLEFARKYDLDICRALACRYFAGLRSCEVERVPDENIFENYIDVKKKNSKQGRARKRRIVTIQPNLRAWLNLGGALPSPPQNGRRMLEFQRALLATGIQWPQNVARHSFCSYHLARFKSAAETALESGHTEAMLFENYRGLQTPCGKLVTVELVVEYFSILPS